MHDTYVYYAIKYKGDYKRIKSAIQNNEEIHPCKVEHPYICYGDAQYPDAFYQLQEPPFVIFYEGDLSLLEKPLISIVGSRKITGLGETYCDILIRSLKSNYVTVSGLAKGVDGYIHRASMNHHQTIGIIGCGLNVIYPYEHKALYQEMKQHHLILSEYPADTKPLAKHFPFRNRLIAALGSKLVVVEGNLRSGTLLTVNEALLLNKDIFCFPHPFVEDKVSVCNLLIQEGASVLVDIKMIKEL